MYTTAEVAGRDVWRVWTGGGEVLVAGASGHSGDVVTMARRVAGWGFRFRPSAERASGHVLALFLADRGVAVDGAERDELACRALYELDGLPGQAAILDR